MAHYQIILAYDGSHFKGFQRQARVRSVQGAVEEALRKLNWQGKSILAAGRTDTGAHATGQVISFELGWQHEPEDLLNALNNHLPRDVAAKEVKRVKASFHPRHDASWRRYHYHIYSQPVREPLLEPYAWRVWPAVELEILQQSAQELVGSYDFGAFGTPPIPGGSTVRRVLKSEWRQEAPYLIYEITAHAFLYHMVRRLVFMQVMIAQGKVGSEVIKNALAQGRNGMMHIDADKASSRSLVHGLAPAQGLILAEVHYPVSAVLLGE